MKKILEILLSILPQKWTSLPGMNPRIKVISQKDARACTLLGISLDFHWSIVNFPKEGEKEEIQKIVEYHKEGDENYDLKNWCCRPYNLGEENKEKIIYILTKQAQGYPNIESLKQKDLSALQMLKIVKGFIEQVPLSSIEEIMDLVKKGAAEYFEAEKDTYSGGKHEDSFGKRFLDLSERIVNNEDSLMIATGMCISSILAHIYKKTGIIFFP